MKILNQHNKYIIDQDIITKIEHMVNHGYGSIQHNGMMASYDHEEIIEDERYIFINVEGI